jgi:hypothetical protein
MCAELDQYRHLLATEGGHRQKLLTSDYAAEINPVGDLWVTWRETAPLTKKPYKRVSACRASSS